MDGNTEARRPTKPNRAVGALDMHGPKLQYLVMKDTYSIKDLQEETAAAIHAAECGTLVTITRRDRPVAHVISTARLGRHP